MTESQKLRKMMEEFLCNIITNSTGDGHGLPSGGARTVLQSTTMSAPGPVTVTPPTSALENHLGNNASQLQLIPWRNRPLQVSAAMNVATPTPSGNSILITDMSHMIAWLTSQNSQSQVNSYSNPISSTTSSQYTSQYEPEGTRTILKAYKVMSPMDCANVVARSTRQILLHTCNDEFRQQCFQKLGVSSSRDVELEIRRRLNEMLAQQTQESLIATDSSPGESLDAEGQQP